MASHTSVVAAKGTKVRQVSDYAVPQKETNGHKLTGRWYSRATAPVTRTIPEHLRKAPKTPNVRGTWERDGLGPHNYNRGLMYESLAR